MEEFGKWEVVDSNERGLSELNETDVLDLESEGLTDGLSFSLVVAKSSLWHVRNLDIGSSTIQSRKEMGKCSGNSADA